MRFMFRHVGSGLILALIFLSALSHYAYAESGDNITLTPTDKHYSLNAGDQMSDHMTIINNGTTSYSFKVYARPYAVQDAGYQPTFKELNQYADGYKWISIPAVVYHLNPGEKVDVPYDIIVSAGARSGGHYAAIFAEAQGTVQEGQTGIASNKSVGMLVYINVKGHTLTAGGLKSLDMPWYQPAAPLTAIPRIENTGETDFDTTITFAVMDIAGDVKYQTTGIYTLLPKTERDVRFTWDKSPWFGLYKVRLSTTILGKTEIHESFIVIAPRWLLFIALLAILLGGIHVVRRKRTASSRKAH